MTWLVSLIAGLLAAALQYGRAAASVRMAPLALLRALVVGIVVALLLEAPVGRVPLPATEVVLDGSESWLRAAPACTNWRSARDSAARMSRGHWLRFGDSLRTDAGESLPRDHTSRFRSAADRASSTGTPLVVITDGELDDAELLASLPRGSRVIAMPCEPAPDIAIANLEAPRALLAGDTLHARATLLAGAKGAPPVTITLQLNDALLASKPVAALAPWAEQTVELTALTRATVGPAVLRVAASSASPREPQKQQGTTRGQPDAEPRNDTLALGVEVTRAPGAVFVSTAPDFDAREALAALRGVTSLPTRAWFRVAPGSWRAEGSLAHASEADVRAAVRDAPLVVLHGDTSVFGPPRAATRASLLLFAPPVAEGEWFAAPSPPSPLSAALAGIPFDSLPPLTVAPSLPAGQWVGLVTHRGGSAGDRRVALVGWDEPRRIAVLGASGLWRWRFRGGARAQAFDALFGSLYDWLAGGRTEKRAVALPEGVVRAGAPLAWRRGSSADSVVTVVLRRRGGDVKADTVRLRFESGAATAETSGLDAGIYDVSVPGGHAVLAVNASRELLPRRATVSSGPVGGASSQGDRRSARDLGWLYALGVLLLCAEWLGRRRVGLR